MANIKIFTHIIYDCDIYTDELMNPCILSIHSNKILHSKKDIYFSAVEAPPDAIFIPSEQFNFKDVIAFSKI